MTGPDRDEHDAAVGRIALELAELHDAGHDVADVLRAAEAEARAEVGSVAALAVIATQPARPLTAAAEGPPPPGRTLYVHPGALEQAATIRDAVLELARNGHDLGDTLSGALAAAAEQLGSIAELVGGRPGSWESVHVAALAGVAATADGLGENYR